MSAKATAPFEFRIHQMADECDQSEGYLDSADGTLFSVEFADHDADETRAVVAELTRRLNAFDDLLGALALCNSVLQMLTAPEVIRATNVAGVWAQCVEAEAKARQAIHRASESGPSPAALRRATGEGQG